MYEYCTSSCSVPEGDEALGTIHMSSALLLVDSVYHKMHLDSEDGRSEDGHTD